jgi:DNA-binding transcriptional MerR regulator
LENKAIMNVSEISLAEMAERSGVPARTIRLYISKGLLPGPLRSGRNASYGAGHLDTLLRIRELQRNGLTLSQVGRSLAGSDSPAQLPGPVAWQRFVLSDDVEISVRGGLAPWRMKAIADAMAEFNARLGDAAEKEKHDGRC